jgi:hypothetical protein
VRADPVGEAMDDTPEFTAAEADRIAAALIAEAAAAEAEAARDGRASPGVPAGKLHLLSMHIAGRPDLDLPGWGGGETAPGGP